MFIVGNARYVQNPFFVLHVTLWSEDTQFERSIILNEPKCTRVLMGSIVSSPNILRNVEGELGCYFCFPDLSIRTEGRYTLKFSLIRLDSDKELTREPPRTIMEIFSDPFTVYSAKKFPGMTGTFIAVSYGLFFLRTHALFCFVAVTTHLLILWHFFRHGYIIVAMVQSQRSYPRLLPSRA